MTTLPVGSYGWLPDGTPILIPPPVLIIAPVVAPVVAPVTVANTIAETVLISTTVIADLFRQAGESIQVNLLGRLGKNNGNRTWTFRLKINGVTLLAVALQQSGAAVAGAGFQIEAQATIRTAGVAGTIISGMRLEQNVNSNPPLISQPAATAIINTIGTKLIQFTVQLSAADPALSCVTEQGQLGIRAALP